MDTLTEVVTEEAVRSADKEICPRVIVVAIIDLAVVKSRVSKKFVSSMSPVVVSNLSDKRSRWGERRMHREALVETEG
jgi:hypothetical protein